MPGKRTGIAQAEVYIGVTVNVGQARIMGLSGKNGKRARPLGHPAHGDSPEQGLPGSFKKKFRSGALFGETLFLALDQRFDADPI